MINEVKLAEPKSIFNGIQLLLGRKVFLFYSKNTINIDAFCNYIFSSKHSLPNIIEDKLAKINNRSKMESTT